MTELTANLRQALSRALTRLRPPDARMVPAATTFPAEFDDSDRMIVDRVLQEQLSMCGRENLNATLLACKYIRQASIAGDFVECGVWRGGNSLLAAHEFSKADTSSRRVYLLDTFAGMAEPTEVDTRVADGSSAVSTYLEKSDNSGKSGSNWCLASLDEVKRNFSSFGLLGPNIHFVEGEVEKVLGGAGVHELPEKVAVLRLDTDWYTSTKSELEFFWPRLSVGGIVIIDDYGYWAGCRRAVNEFFGSRIPFLHPINNNSRLIVRTSV